MRFAYRLISSSDAHVYGNAGNGQETYRVTRPATECNVLYPPIPPIQNAKLEGHVAWNCFQ